MAKLTRLQQQLTDPTATSRAAQLRTELLNLAETLHVPPEELAKELVNFDASAFKTGEQQPANRNEKHVSIPQRGVGFGETPLNVRGGAQSELRGFGDLVELGVGDRQAALNVFAAARDRTIALTGNAGVDPRTTLDFELNKLKPDEVLAVRTVSPGARVVIIRSTDDINTLMRNRLPELAAPLKLADLEGLIDASDRRASGDRTRGSPPYVDPGVQAWRVLALQQLDARVRPLQVKPTLGVTVAELGLPQRDRGANSLLRAGGHLIELGAEAPFDAAAAVQGWSRDRLDLERSQVDPRQVLARELEALKPGELLIVQTPDRVLAIRSIADINEVVTYHSLRTVTRLAFEKVEQFIDPHDLRSRGDASRGSELFVDPWLAANIDGQASENGSPEAIAGPEQPGPPSGAARLLRDDGPLVELGASNRTGANVQFRRWADRNLTQLWGSTVPAADSLERELGTLKNDELLVVLTRGQPPRLFVLRSAADIKALLAKVQPDLMAKVPIEQVANLLDRGDLF